MFLCRTLFIFANNLEGRRKAVIHTLVLPFFGGWLGMRPLLHVSLAVEHESDRCPFHPEPLLLAPWYM